jgi:hypothetical protein
MPTDKSGKQSQPARPRFSISALTAAATQISTGTKGSDKAVAGEKKRIDKTIARREALSETPQGQRTLRKEAKAQKDRDTKAVRRGVAKQLGLSGDSTAASSKQTPQKQAANAQKSIDKMMGMAAGKNRKTGKDSRKVARQIKEAITKGPVVGRDDKTGKEIRDPKLANTVFGKDTARVLAVAEQRIGKAYSGKGERTGTYRAKAPDTGSTFGTPSGRGRAGIRQEYVGNKKGAGGTVRSKNFIGPKRPRGRPSGGGKKNKPQ